MPMTPNQMMPRGLVPNASPLMPVDYRAPGGGVTLMNIPQPQMQQPTAAAQGMQGMAGAMAPGGLLSMLQKQRMADAASQSNMTIGGQIAGQVPMDTRNMIGSQIAAASIPGAGMGPSITGKMVSGGGMPGMGGQTGWMDWLKQSPLMGWFGNIGS